MDPPFGVGLWRGFCGWVWWVLFSQGSFGCKEDGKDRCLNAVRELSQAFALAVPHPETARIRDDVGFFQAVRAALSKRAATAARPEEELDLAVRQIISRAVASEDVMDIFAAAGRGEPCS